MGHLLNCAPPLVLLSLFFFIRGALGARTHTTGDGRLDLGELAVLLAALGADLTPAQVALFRDSIDVNGDGFVSLNEFQVKPAVR